MQHMHKGSALVTDQDIGENPSVIEHAKRMGLRLITFGPHCNAQVREMGFHNGNLQIGMGSLRLGITLQSDGHHMALKDRKSTRLNSSHLVISYAVFCLKKKKQKLNFIHNMIVIERRSKLI